MPPYITPRDADLSDAESARSAQPPSAPSKKEQREMRLREDKLADVQGPTLVHCLNCGAAIKLSLKSEYDASHWIRHRTRCVKKTKARELERGMQSASSTAGSSPTTSARALTPHDDDDSRMGAPRPRITIPDPLDRTRPALRTDFPVFYDWQAWDWSQLKSRFDTP
ncbi:hypothetical protein C8R44DRAFT_67337 [Mycena epipterygia]|nr:hypothetical protein C8R44DRAFT_67337 [Mycena epipterygia]